GGGVLFDRAEQHQLFAGIVRRHGDAMVGDRDDQPLGLRPWDGEGHAQHQHGEDGDMVPCAHPVTPVSRMVKRSSGRITSSIAKRIPTARTRSPSKSRNCSPRIFCPARAPNCAPVTPPTIRISASTTSTRWLVTACNRVANVMVTRVSTMEVPITVEVGTRNR